MMIMAASTTPKIIMLPLISINNESTWSVYVVCTSSWVKVDVGKDLQEEPVSACVCIKAALVKLASPAL